MGNLSKLQNDYKCSVCQEALNKISHLQDQPRISPNNKCDSPHTHTPQTNKQTGQWENITMRAPRRLITSCDYQQNESVLLNISHQSLPSAMENSEECNELREDNVKLRSELKMANSEIDNLSIEIMNLKHTLETTNKKLEFCKSVGLHQSVPFRSTAAPGFFSPQYRRITPNTVQGGFPRRTPTEFTNRVVEKITPIKLCPIELNDHVTTIQKELLPKTIRSTFKANEAMASVLTQETKNTTNKTKPQHQSQPKRRVMILADEQGKGMRSILQESLGSGYIVESILRPNATMDQVMKSCLSLCNNYGRNDIVIVLGGSNDKDPLRMKSLLYYNLSIMLQCKIIICKTVNSKHLNEEMINCTFRHICSRFTHTTLLGISKKDDKKYFGKYRLNRQYACQQLFEEIIRINPPQKDLTQCKISRQTQTGLPIDLPMLINVETQTEDLEINYKNDCAITGNIGNTNNNNLIDNDNDSNNDNNVDNNDYRNNDNANDVTFFRE